jgi:hypothetical protein
MEAPVSVETMENLVRIGMLAVIRDVQEYLEDRAPFQVGGTSVIPTNDLHAYLLACLVTAGCVPDMPHGQG